MSQPKPSKTDQILDLLLDALLERQKARARGDKASGAEDHSPGAGRPVDATAKLAAAPQSESRPTSEKSHHPRDEVEASREPAIDNAAAALPPPVKLPTIHLERMLGRLALVLLGLIITVNIPFNRFGTSLARALPDQKALIVRDGLVLKGSGPEIFVLENNQRRWISSLEAFDQLGYRWEQVNEVDDAFLARFPEGRPIHLLLKCATSPHVYAFENGVKRWIKDIPTFTDQGYVWDDVQIVTCGYLRSLPDGVPIPPDAGEPPQP